MFNRFLPESHNKQLTEFFELSGTNDGNNVEHYDDIPEQPLQKNQN